MTGLILGATVPALDNPEPSATKLGRQWGEQIDWEHVKETASQPSTAVAAPLRPRRLTEESARAPKWMTGSFRVPYGMRAHQLADLCREMATKWFDEMRRMGFDVLSSTHVDVQPGPNPSRDLASGLIVPGYRDFLIRAQFVERQPEIVRMELPGGLFEEFRPRQLPTSSGDEE